ncbi:hypothetical protein AKJ09_10517 [Labilithrix luteola]|uniref:PEGA domain-containing protein n=1 Tax=Labilithrix luteola TaxID=1391654 RepID=A0A0K1QDL5_9BACT|nr:tetratricopeptide repeat protein [Labilithrix luteola]AKV03854.1 hypothetical protein AKJ09_10517 [Labilithrix luteola]
MSGARWRSRWAIATSFLLPTLCICSCLAASREAFAADAPQTGSAASAEELFQQARVLVEKGRYDEACPKLEESHRLEPAVGTQFNLADCYEHLGRAASAHATFLKVAAIARAAGKFEREKSANERARALEPRLAKLHLVVKASAPGLELRLDDAPLAREDWQTPLPVDPGSHRVTAAAPDHRTFETTIVAKESTTLDLDVPPLVDTRPAVTIPTTPAPSSPQRTLALVTGGVGVVAVGVGTVFGILALSHHSNAESACASDMYQFRCPTENGASEWNAARTAGNLSTAGFIAGGVLLAGAAVLWFTAPRAHTRVGASASGIVAAGTF